MTRSTLFPAAPVAPAPSGVAAVVTLTFDADGVTASTAGRLAVAALAVQGNRAVVLTVPGLGGAAAQLVGQTAAVRVAGDVVVVTYPGSVPASGTGTLILAERPRGATKRADNSLAPAPPAAFGYTEREGQTGALTMAVDSRTTAVRIEAHDAGVTAGPGGKGGAFAPDTPARIWTALRTDAAAAGVLTLPLTPAEDQMGRRFRAVALRDVAGDVAESAPSAETYRNRAPVSAGNALATLYTAADGGGGQKTGRFSLVGLITDPDGGEVTFRVPSRHDAEGRDSLPAWAVLDGDALVVDTAEPRAPVVLTVVGVDERAATATATVTLSVRTLSLAAPTAAVYYTL